MWSDHEHGIVHWAVYRWESLDGFSLNWAVSIKKVEAWVVQSHLFLDSFAVGMSISGHLEADVVTVVGHVTVECCLSSWSNKGLDIIDNARQCEGMHVVNFIPVATMAVNRCWLWSILAQTILSCWRCWESLFSARFIDKWTSISMD